MQGYLLAAVVSWIAVGSTAVAENPGPAERDGLVLWLDAQDLAGTGDAPANPAHGAAVGRWADRSGHDNDAVQAAAERRPTYAAIDGAGGLSCVRFSMAKGQHLAIPDRPSLDIHQLTAFVVARVEAAPTNMWLLGKNSFAGEWTGYGIAVEGPSSFAWPHLGLGHSGPEGNGYVRYPKSLRDGFAIIELSFDGERLRGALSGLELTRSVAGAIQANDLDLLVGASPQVPPAAEFLEGDIAELLIYDRPLAPAEVERTRGYLAAKYGLKLADAGDRFPMMVIENGYLPVTVDNPATPETRQLTPREAEEALIRDWLYQADGSPTAERVTLEIGWARELAARLRGDARAPDLSGELAELDGLAEQAAHLSPDGATEDARTLYLEVRRVKRRIMFRNPAIDFDRLLLTDQPYPAGPEWRHEAVHRMGHRAVPGGRLLVLEGLGPGAAIRQLAPARPGSFWRPDLSFDARRVVFCYKAYDEGSFHLYEIGVDGAGLRQLTEGPYDDIDPICLPDGRLAFMTTRGNTYVRCGPYIYCYALACCDSDGGNVYLLSTNSEPDFVPSLLADGRIVYSRWEYSDKDQNRVQSLWTTNQDGTYTSALWGNQSIWPDHLAEPRAIPGSGRVMFTGVGHHDWFSGSLGIVDPSAGANYPDGLTKVTCDLPWAEVPPPPRDPPESAGYHASGRFAGYLGAYPLSERDFLVSARGESDRFRVYLMDVSGNRELIYEGAYNAWYAIPIRPRPIPPRQTERVVWPGKGQSRQPARPGTFYNPDVYAGVPELARGSVKYLRVMLQEAKTYSTWHKTFRMSGPPVSVVQEEAVKRVASTVPLDADGSVYFEVPVGQSLYFQLLDENQRAMQTMRSFTGAMPGEARGCVGCHETRSTAPPQGPGLALHRPPTPVTPPPWGSESIGYERFAQPVLDHYCGECHQGQGSARSVLDLTLRPGWDVFKEPYLTLVGSALWVAGGQNIGSVALPRPDAPGYGIAAPIPVYMLGARYDDHNDPAALATLPPMRYLSYGSRLIELAGSGRHYGVRADPLSLLHLTVWVDANSPYLGAEEIHRMEDPEFPGIELLPIRPRLRTAPVVARP
jgi:hypothetical protein